MRIDDHGRAREERSVLGGLVVLPVEKHEVAWTDEHRHDAHVRYIARLDYPCAACALEQRDPALEFSDDRGPGRDLAGTTASNAELLDALDRGRSHSRIVAEPEVVIGGEVEAGDPTHRARTSRDAGDSGDGDLLAHRPTMEYSAVDTL